MRRDAGYLNISKTDFDNMDLREFTDYKYGSMLNRQNDFNNEQTLLHSIAGKVAQAVWGDKDFKKQLKSVDWTSSILADSVEVKISDKQKATLDRIEKQYGIKLNRVEEDSDNG